MFARLEKKAEPQKKGVRSSYRHGVQRQTERSGSVYDLPALSYGQAPVQRITDDDLPEIQRDLLSMLGDDVPSRDEIRQLLINYYTKNSGRGTRQRMAEWLARLSVEDAEKIILEQVGSRQGSKKVFSFGDQELGTAEQAMQSRYTPFATFLHSNDGEVMEERRGRILKGGGSVRGPLMLTSGGHMQYAEPQPHGMFRLKPNSYLRKPQAGADMPRSIFAFDHPYTSGYHTNPKTRADVQGLTNNFYEYGKHLGAGRFHLLVRAQDRGGRDTRGVYNLEPDELYLYGVQRTNVKSHATTMGSYSGAPIDPSKQSLIYKFADFKVLFHVLNELAEKLYRNPYDEDLQSAFMQRLNDDLDNHRFPPKLRDTLKGYRREINEAEELMSDDNREILRNILEAIIHFNPANEATGESTSMDDAMSAGDQEFSDDELD
ncbi:MAG: hypothetical protein HDQ95_03985 [Roseburia sp.]|nr:hypothetical protein [Roseburia sp.]